jgi:hypothetical protein
METRTMLTYEGATFKPALYYIGAAACCLLAVWFIAFPAQVPPPGAVTGPPAAKIFIGFAGVCLFLSGILDALFVWYYNYFYKKIAYDSHNLYITRKNGEQVISFADINSIRMTVGLNTNTRGIYRVWLIRFRNGEEISRIRLPVYTKMGNNFSGFRKLVRLRNPNLEMEN